MAASPSSRPACEGLRKLHSADPRQAGRSAHRPACRSACRESHWKSTARCSTRHSFRGTRERNSGRGRWTSVRTVWAHWATRHCATARLRRYHARIVETRRLDSQHPFQVRPQCPSSAPICSQNTTRPVRATRHIRPLFSSPTPSIPAITIGLRRTRERHRRIFRSTSIFQFAACR